MSSVLVQRQVQKQLLKLESGGVLVSRLAGRTRLYEWNPRNVLVPLCAETENVQS